MSSPVTSVDPLGDRLLQVFWRKPAETLAERTRRRVSLHLIPVLFALYILAYLDRVNVSAAQLKMELPPDAAGLGFTREVIGFGAGLFFWGYWILEIPSTLSVVRWGARWVFCRILVLWGVCATLVGFIGLPLATSMFGWLPHLSSDWAWPLSSVATYINALPTNPEMQFYFFRFALGFFEGGFFPSVILYLTFWFRGQDRAKAVASFMSAIPLSSALGLPASGMLLRVNWFGLTGWRWIFIVEGLLPIVAGVAVLWFLPNRPRDAKWLTPEERDWLEGELEREHHAKRAHGFGAWKHHLGMVVLLTGVYFCLNVASYGLSMFMPAIFKSQLRGISDETATLIASLPYCMAFIGMMVNGWHSDRTGERIWHVATPLAFSSLGIFLAALFDGVPYVPALLMIFVVGTCLYAHQPAFWPIPSMFLGAAAAASAIGFINMVGNLGGFYGPNWVGKADEVKAAVAAANPGKESPGTASTPAAGSASEKAENTAEGGEATSAHAAATASTAEHSPKGAASSAAAPAGFRQGLFRLAPWPILASIVILIVGFFRRQKPVTVPPA